MGVCTENHADKTKFIISEDFKIKQKLLTAFQNKIKKEKTEKNKEFEENFKDFESQKKLQNTTIGNIEKIISKNKLKVTDVYNIEGELGEGGYGKVFLVRHKKMNQLRAMKMISINSKKDGEKTDDEIELLKKLDHPNIVKLFEYFSDEDKYYLITEYCKGGDFSDLIIKDNRKFSEYSASYIMYQIFRALIYCHNTHNVIHRDIKPENIVIYRKSCADDDLYDVKLIDFGIAKIFNSKENEDKIDSDDIKGSFYYMAPECFQKKQCDNKVDIWSCGVILYMLVVGKHPFKVEKNLQQTEKNIIEGHYTFPEGFNNHSHPTIRDLIQQCLKTNPSERISAKKAIDHPFFNLYETKNHLIHVTEQFLNKTINNIKKYEIKNPLQELTFTYLVHNYPNQEEITLINRVFTKFNSNNDGKLTRDELKKGLLKSLFKRNKSGKAADKDVNAIFKKLDGNNNGYIECEEFVRAGIDKKLLKNKKVLEFTFDFLDKNGNGEISVEELKEVFGIGNEEDEKALIDLMKSMDTDFNGQISFDEFYNMMIKIIDGLI